MRPTCCALVLFSFVLVSLVACGSTAPVSHPPPNEGESGSSGGVSPDDPSLSIDPQVCASDADCMVGTPRDCCTSFCPEDAVAWSHAAWASYQDECAVEECAAPESLACRPEAPRSFTAVCRAGRCALAE
jgi:hypothetical protein